MKPRAYSKHYDGGRSVPPWKAAGSPHNAAMQPRRVASAAAMLADPSRAAIVLALMDGRSRSAKKLALDAGVTPQTASTHLKKLVAAEMLVWERDGRSKSFRLAGADVAQAVEALSAVGTRRLPAAHELRFARCSTTTSRDSSVSP